MARLAGSGKTQDRCRKSRGGHLNQDPLIPLLPASLVAPGQPNQCSALFTGRQGIQPTGDPGIVLPTHRISTAAQNCRTWANPRKQVQQLDGPKAPRAGKPDNPAQGGIVALAIGA